jgi:hypothetical protein
VDISNNISEHVAITFPYSCSTCNITTIFNVKNTTLFSIGQQITIWYGYPYGTGEDRPSFSLNPHISTDYASISICIIIAFSMVIITNILSGIIYWLLSANYHSEYHTLNTTYTKYTEQPKESCEKNMHQTNLYIFDTEYLPQRATSFAEHDLTDIYNPPKYYSAPAIGY